MSRDKEKLEGFLIGTLVGGLLGSALALLYAPVSGKRLRRDLSRKTEDFIEDASDYWERGKERAETFYKDGKKKADSIVDDAKKKLG
jgi:gas vesicle protein